MKTGHFLRGGTGPAALGSLVSLGAQATMALFLLGLFEPQAVGVFSVVAQIAFGWATLALAQSPVSLLANQHLPPLPAARQAWHSSLRRWLWLTPAAALAMWWSGRSAAAGLPASWDWAVPLAWVCAIALTQMGWLLAQSLTLRQHAPVSIAAVRMLPPMIAALLAAVLAIALDWRSSSALTSAALAGYAVGALWLLPALRNHEVLTRREDSSSSTGDPRSERLKFIHTLSDVLVATVLATHWTAVYGAAQAGCLLILLRVMGFIPALVSTAWAQVVLGRPQSRLPSSAWAAGAGAAAVMAVGLAAHLALQTGWLSERWLGLQDYLWPVALWQMAASIMAAVSHRPFQRGLAVRYTWQCLTMNAGQALLLVLPPLLGWSLTEHLWVLAGFLSMALLLQAGWAARLVHPTSEEHL